MKNSRFTTEQIIGFIKQAEAGLAVAELAREHGFSPASIPHPDQRPSPTSAVSSIPSGQDGYAAIFAAGADFFSIALGTI